MSEVASRELRNETRAVLDRVHAGEQITITVDGRPVAELVPLSSRRRWVPREGFEREIVTHQADPALQDDLDVLADQSTDDLPLP